MITVGLVYDGINAQGQAQFSTRWNFDRDLCTRKLNQGDKVRAKVTRPRSQKQHNAFFKAIDSAFHNRCEAFENAHPHIDSALRLRKHLLIRAGHCEVWELDPKVLGGPVNRQFIEFLKKVQDDVEFYQVGDKVRAKKARSIEKVKVDGDDFQPIVDAVFHLITSEVCPGTSIKQHLSNIKEEAA